MSLLVDVRKQLGSFALDVSFSVEDARETMALLGPSGCGKSMTLKCVAGIVRPDEGRIVLNGRTLFDSERGIDLPPQRRRVGYLFQQYALFPTMTVEQNIAAGAVGAASRAERRERVAEQVAAFRLEGLERLRPAQLSGGQQQRVALARILAGSPELLLLDEPFSALDDHLRWQLELELSDTLKTFSGGSLLVTHNRDEVFRLCDTVCVVSHGRSQEKLTKHELFSTPRTLAAALISGCKNVTRAHVVAPGRLACEDWGVELATALPVGEDVTHAGVRARLLRVRAAGRVGAWCEGIGRADAARGGEPGAALGESAVARGEEKPVAQDGEKDAQDEAAPANAIPCTLERSIESTFSQILMLKTPGGGLLRLECKKDEWAALALDASRELLVSCDAADVMPLVGGGADA